MKIKSIILGISVCVFCLGLSIFIQVCFPSYINYLFSKYAYLENTGISQEDTYDIAKSVSDLLIGKLDEFEITGRKDLSAILSNREKIHMNDVKNIFTIIKCILFLSILFIIVILVFYRYKISYKAYMYSIIAFLFMILLISAFSYINFNTVFILLHKILFTNGFWILRPGEDLIISLMPINLFINMAINALFIFICLLISLSFLIKHLIKIR